MQLKFGSVPVVVASYAEMAKLFLKTHDQIFASRPQLAAESTPLITIPTSLGLLMDPIGVPIVGFQIEFGCGTV
ncbi:hypothetical protein L484_027401 [Morus notabilis]|uniref:Uncharacterized protein n=1 Tax=Morus notabilis TaxID=981085 RepID=W9QK18_9ROSA|nr:hypothetical protein L484_027401 [Morus notabilis]